MRTQRTPQRRSPIRRPAALATGVLTALALTVPVAEAGAATLQAPPPSAVVTGPTLSGDVFNGSTVIVTSPSPASGTINAPMN
jgi:hypothetical protein